LLTNPPTLSKQREIVRMLLCVVTTSARLIEVFWFILYSKPLERSS